MHTGYGKRKTRYRAAMPRLFVTGASGHLGGALARRAANAGWTVTGTSFSASGWERLDIRDRRAVEALVRRVRPDAVVHTAAGRDDWRVIADGAAHVALAASAVDARLVHVSSDAIFSGDDDRYDETAVPDPIYPYGAAKAAAETAVRAVAPAAAVVRTSLIIGDGRGGHELLTHRLVAGEVAGTLFTDQVRMPVHADDLADALLELAAGDYAGVLNVAGPDAISRYDLGVLVARRDGLDPAAVPAGHLAGSGLRGPAVVLLDCARAAALLRTRLRGAHEFMSTVDSR
jgi:dTDP-4-dehydrorhamnose reductase